MWGQEVGIDVGIFPSPSLYHGKAERVLPLPSSASIPAPGERALVMPLHDVLLVPWVWSCECTHGAAQMLPSQSKGAANPVPEMFVVEVVLHDVTRRSLFLGCAPGAGETDASPV